MKRSNDHSVLGRPLCVGRIKPYRSLWRHWKYRFHVANIRSCFHNGISWTCKGANSLEKMVPTRHLYPYRNYYQTSDTAGIWIQLSCLWLVQSLTRDGQLSHKEGHSGLSFPSPCGEQHNSVSHNGEDKQDPQGYQLFRLKETV